MVRPVRAALTAGPHFRPARSAVKRARPAGGFSFAPFRANELIYHELSHTARLYNRMLCAQRRTKFLTGFEFLMFRVTPFALKLANGGPPTDHAHLTVGRTGHKQRPAANAAFSGRTRSIAKKRMRKRLGITCACPWIADAKPLLPTARLAYPQPLRRIRKALLRQAICVRPCRAYSCKHNNRFFNPTAGF